MQLNQFSRPQKLLILFGLIILVIAVALGWTLWTIRFAQATGRPALVPEDGTIRLIAKCHVDYILMGFLLLISGILLNRLCFGEDTDKKIAYLLIPGAIINPLGFLLTPIAGITNLVGGGLITYAVGIFVYAYVRYWWRS